MLNSNNKTIGTPKNNWDTMSGGVMIAATIKMIRINTGCLSNNIFGLINPTTDNKNTTIGISKTNPKQRSVVLIKDTNEAIDTIGFTPGIVILTKKFIVIGNTTL